VYTDGLEALICARAWNCAEAIAVAACESGRDMSGRLDGQWATNGNHYGIFQISYVHAPNFPGFYENWMDPVFNIEVAFAIWSEQGWYPWSCRPY
jgi:Lysozyme like domain